MCQRKHLVSLLSLDLFQIKIELLMIFSYIQERYSTNEFDAS